MQIDNNMAVTGHILGPITLLFSPTCWAKLAKNRGNSNYCLHFKWVM